MKYYVKITMAFDDADVMEANSRQTAEGFEPYYPANTQRIWWKSYDVDCAEQALHDCMMDFAQSHMECYTYGKPVTFAVCNDEYDEFMRKRQEDEQLFSNFLHSIIPLYDQIEDYESSASALYTGGWRARDRDQLILEYDLSEDEADKLCEFLTQYEKEESQ